METGKEMDKEMQKKNLEADEMNEKKRSEEMVRIAIRAMDAHKAEEIQVIDISRVSTLADYFVVVNGTNASQIQALADAVEKGLGRAGFPCRQVEGYEHASWILLDFGDVIVHIFDGENRLLYSLERIWGDGVTVDPDTFR